MPAYSKEFGITLEKLIELRGFTKKEVAEKIGYTAGGFNHFVNGRVPDGLLLKKLADILSVSMEELLGEDLKPQVYPPEVDKLIAILDRGDPETRGFVRGILESEYRKLEKPPKAVGEKGG